MVQWVRYPVLSLLWLELLLWHRFDPCLGNFHIPRAQLKKKKRMKIQIEFWFTLTH